MDGKSWNLYGPVPIELSMGLDSLLAGGKRRAELREILGERGLESERYRAPELLGKGGMGAVYAAVDGVLGREVAVKIALRSDELDDLSRFLTEARVMAGLSHPAIIRVNDLGLDAEGLPRYRALRTELGELERANRAARREVRALKRRVARLRDDPGAVEAIARDELGMLREGETLFQFEP